MNNKVIRSICIFSKSPDHSTFAKLGELESTFGKDFTIQTKRICSPDIDRMINLSKGHRGKNLVFGLGKLNIGEIQKKLSLLLSEDIHFNLDLTNEKIGADDISLLFDIIKSSPYRTFNFAYEFNNSFSSPFFPSANYEKEGFSIGLQPTDLAEGCESLEEWLSKMKNLWMEIDNLFENKADFLGIDSSIAPIFSGKSSFINFIRKLSGSFEKSTTTDVYTRITNFIKNENPRPVGLCGLMFPALEDFELTEEYDKGNFPIERNIYLSLQSGLGIDTYPIGIDEKPERILEILQLVQALSNKYRKPLSVRFVSDGIAKIGEKTDFKNQYLKDIIIKPL